MEPKPRWQLALLVLVLVDGGLLALFYDHYLAWKDEGYFGYVAELILDGRLLGRDIHQHHPGLAHMINALALGLFGRNLVALRYPLALAGLVQSVVVFFVLLPWGRVRAVTGGVGMLALGLFHFLNPCLHWYVGLGTVVTMGVMAGVPPGRRRNLVLGFLTALVMLMRLPNGGLLGGSILVFLVLEAQSDAMAHEEGRAGALASLGLGGAIALAYLVQVHLDLFSALIIGVWPLALTAVAAREARASWRRVWLEWVGPLGIGVLAGLAPMVAYYAGHGALGAWLTDVFVRARAVLHLDYHQGGSLSGLWSVGWMELQGPGWLARLNGLQWLLLPLVPALAGLMSLVTVALDPFERHRTALLVIGVFYAPVALVQHTLIYLSFVMGVSAATLLGVTASRPRLGLPCLAALWLLIGVALYSHAGQPYERATADLFGGVRVPTEPCPQVPNCGLKLWPPVARQLQAVVEAVEDYSGPQDSLYCPPNNNLLNFLSGRPLPFPVINSAVGLQDPADMQLVVKALEHGEVHLVVHDTEDKHNLPVLEPMLAALREHYTLVEEIGPYRYYLPQGTPVPPHRPRQLEGWITTR